MAISGGWRSYAYNCIFVVYTKKNQGKYFLTGKNQGIIREFHFQISVATLKYIVYISKGMHCILRISIPYISDKKPVYLLALTLETDVNKEILENLIIVYLF